MSCNFKKGEIVRCKNTGVIYLGTGTALRKFDVAGWNAVRAKRTGLVYRDASCSNIASCKKGEPATASNLVSNLALIDVGPMAAKKPAVKPPVASVAGGSSTCNFKKGEIVRCKNTGIIYLATGTALRKFDVAGWKAVRASRVGLSYRDASCSNIASCKKGEPATAQNLASNLSLIDAGPMSVATKGPSVPTMIPVSITTQPARSPACNFEKGVLVYCIEGGDSYVFDDANRMWAIGGEVLAEITRRRPGLKSVVASCDDIVSCASRGTAVLSDVDAILSLLDAGPLVGFTRPPTTVIPSPVPLSNTPVYGLETTYPSSSPWPSPVPSESPWTSYGTSAPPHSSTPASSWGSVAPSSSSAAPSSWNGQTSSVPQATAEPRSSILRPTSDGFPNGEKSIKNGSKSTTAQDYDNFLLVQPTDPYYQDLQQTFFGR